MKEYIIKTNEDGSKVCVRDVQLVLLSMLKDIDTLCQKHNIPYWLTGGSALGAVRHKGFIPWDDDADIGMMREDYERFLKVAHELGDGYVSQSYATHKNYNVVVPMKVRKKGTYCEEVNTLLKNKCKECDGLFIDIFVVDYVSENKAKDFLWRVRNGILMVLITLFENLGCNPKILKNRFIRNAKKYGEINKNSPLIGYDLTWTFNSFFKPVVYTKESVFPIQYIKFEGIDLPVPKRPKDMLDVEVSPSHMSFPPEKDQVPKHLKDARF
ncbi:MAG: LicD family protein [Longicatena sp.]